MTGGNYQRLGVGVGVATGGRGDIWVGGEQLSGASAPLLIIR